MIETSVSKIKIADIVQSQVPEYVDVENPLFADFLRSYYYSQEFQGGPVDIITNLVEYKGLDFLNKSNLIDSTSLTEYVDGGADTIYVDSTNGWPNQWGLLKINDEIITYTGIGSTSFTGCVRGFSGIEKNSKTNHPEHLTFSVTGVGTHAAESKVTNLSNVFLNEFLKKLKNQVLNGFQERSLFGDLDESNFIRQAKDFFKSKGTKESFEILFRALYNEDVSLVTPQDFVFKPSDAGFIDDNIILCESVTGNPKNIVGQTLFQDTDPQSSASITNVERVIVDRKVYYKIRLSKDTILGSFVAANKTKTIKSAGIGESILSVDSTVGFKTTGDLEVDGLTVSYTNINQNQFIGVVGLSSDVAIGATVTSGFDSYSYENGDLDDKVSLKILSVTKDIKSEATLQKKGSFIKVSSVGSNKNTVRQSEWIYNTVTKYDVKSVIDLGSFTYRLYLNNTPHLYVDDIIEVINQDKVSQEASILNLGSDYIDVSTLTLNLLDTFYIRRILKTNLGYSADVQNLYDSPEGDILVASNSLPSWQILASNRSRTYDNTLVTLPTKTIYIPNHGFKNGDLVYNQSLYGTDSPSGISSGSSYYVKVQNDSSFYLAETTDKIRRGEYIQIYGSDDIASVGIKTGQILPFSLANRSIKNQSLVKKFTTPTFGSKKVETQREIGLFANGVEIHSYKSDDIVKYGSIKSIDVLNQGSGYDVIQSPRVKLLNVGVGVGASVVLHTKGPITEIIVTNEGSDYEDIPSVSVTGGNGSCNARASMKVVPKVVTFNSSTQGGVVDTANDRFIFKDAHEFVNGEEIIYGIGTTTGTAIGIGTTPGNLVSGQSYYAIVQDEYKISLAKTLNESLSGIGTINITYSGTGDHSFTTKRRRSRVNSIFVESSTDFENREVFAEPKNISFSTDYINIKDHGFSSGEIVRYEVENGSNIGGISSNTNYYAIKIDDDNFRLSSTQTLSNHINITEPGTGKHSFKYPPIEVTITGRQGITTSNATAIAVARGMIVGGTLKTSGTGYGSTVINDEFIPKLSVLEGSGAELQPYVVNGRIEDVIVKNSGKDYFSIPDLNIYGTGTGAKLKANISGGKITSVSVIQKGIGYDNTTTIESRTPGSGSLLKVNLQEWRVNNVEKLASKEYLKTDDAVLVPGRTPDYGLQYVNYYAPRNLRDVKGDDGKSHSPILGWAYDGCPIYGPYGFVNANGTGGLKYLTSSYIKTSAVARENGPSFYEFPAGYFVEDFTYVRGSGDLDEHNGRFCVTPEYPFGVYAYFVTVSSQNVSDISSPYYGTKEPLFPYVIGNTYEYEPIQYNFDIAVNQSRETFDGFARNTSYYNIEDYEFISNQLRSSFEIKSVTDGPIDSINILQSGYSYKVGDSVSFDNTNAGGFGAIAEVTDLVGVGITDITSIATNISNITLVPSRTSITGYSTVPHNIKDGTYLKISGISSNAYSDLEGTYKVKVNEVTSGLGTSLLSTGLTTNFTITDSVRKFSVNDVLKIDDEKLLVTKIDVPNNKLSVIRSYDGTAGAAHTNRAKIVRLEKEFVYETKKDITFSLPKNEVVYFDATSQVGVGLTYGVGIGVTISYVGAGNTTKNIFIPTKSIFIKNHGLNHGEKLSYSSNGGTDLQYSFDGLVQHDLPSELYAVKLNNDLIGIVTTRAGINSDLSRVYFGTNTIGIGNTHYFETQRDIVTVDGTSVDVLVSTASSHLLRPNDIINLSLVSTATSTVSPTFNPVEQFVSIGSSVNPPIYVVYGDTLKFDTSDQSLLDLNIDFFTDPDFAKGFSGTGTTDVQVVRNFPPGVPSSSVEITFTEEVPPILYYKFSSTNTSVVVKTNKDINNHSKIIVDKSKFVGSHSITTTTDTTFTYNIFEYPERVGYTTETSNSHYTTKSVNAEGPIAKIGIIDGGKKYHTIPECTVSSDNGNSAEIISSGPNIGAISKTEILEFGYDYPSDKTLTINASIPKVVTVEHNHNIESIDIISGGSKYLSAPDLILYNEKTDSIDTSSTLVPVIQSGSIKSLNIVDAGGNIGGDFSRLITLNNTNGVGIISATYSNPNATLRLKTPSSGFTTSNPLPFTIGDSIFVENIGIGTTGSGYNSSDYKYKFFTVTGVNTAFGLVNQASITYTLDKDPGFHNGLTFGSVSKGDDLPRFTVNLEKSKFLPNEVISTNGFKTNSVENASGDEYVDFILLDSVTNLKPGDIITGETSGSKATVKNIFDYDGEFLVGTSVNKSFGWERETGKPNVYEQRIQDSDYYQQFSYSLKSRVGISSWSEAVDSLAHISGFKKHSDLQLTSETLAGAGATIKSGISSSSSTILINNPDTTKIFCKSDFDSVYELTSLDSKVSDKVVFKSERLSDSILCVGNRVLELDDISPNFYDDPDITLTTVMDSFDIGNISAVKYYAQIVHDEENPVDDNKTQYVEFTVNHDYTNVYINDYSVLYEVFKIGTFSARLTNETVDILFTPYNSTFKYTITFFKESLSPSVGVGTTSFSNILRSGVTSFIADSPTPTKQTIQSFDASAYRSGSLVISVHGEDKFYSTEAAFVGVGSTVHYTVYGEMSNAGLGTFSMDMSGTNTISLDWHSISGYGLTVSTLATLVGVATTVPGTGIPASRWDFGDTRLKSTIDYISANPTPTGVKIVSSNVSDFNAVKLFIEVYNVTDNDYSCFQLAIRCFEGSVSYNKFANISSAVDYQRDMENTYVEYDVSDNEADLFFLPLANKDYEYRVSQIVLRSPDDFTRDSIATLQ